jgi:hypothetical protein
MVSLALNSTTWDLFPDVNGNLALVTGNAALAQDAATACRLWTNEYWYATNIGIPYQNIIGKTPNFTALKALWVAAALTVPGVVSAQAFIAAFQNRNVTGQIQVTGSDGAVSAANFTVGPGPGALFLQTPAQSGFDNIVGVT